MSFTLRELTRTLSETLQTGKIGIPVSARIRITSSATTEQLLPAVMTLLSSVWEEKHLTLRATQHKTGLQTDLQLHLESGPTISISLIQNSPQESCRFLLIGNHGVIRLEGEDDFDFTPNPDSAPQEIWNQLLQKSLSTGQPVQYDQAATR